MIFSKPVFGTNKKKTTLSWFEYILFSCIQQGWYNCWYAYKNWADLMGNNFQDYAIRKEDDPLEECILCFWDSLEDDTYSKKFIEELLQMADDIDSGKVETYTVDEVMSELKNLVGDMEDLEDTPE